MELIDLVPRFEEKSASEHAYNAIAAVGRLRDDGRRLFKDEPDQQQRWQGGCANLEAHISRLNTRSSEDFVAVFRDFVHDFEHDSERMYQMLKGVDEAQESGPTRQSILSWLSFTYQVATYAILASRIPSHQSQSYVTVDIDMASGASNETWSFVKHTVPRKFKSFRKKIR